MNMKATEHRQWRRLKLHLPIVKLGCPKSLLGQEGALTTDISAGGMYFVADLAEPPRCGSKMSFELAAPAGQGYWPTSGRVAGEGEVARVSIIDEQTVGIAMKFTKPLNLAF